MPATIEQLAADAVRPVDSFAYFGDRDLFGTWGFCGVGAQHRDSEPLEQSNHVAIWNDLSERFPDDVEILHSSHCMVGWCDELIVRVYDDSGAITDAFRAVVAWQEKLDAYPVADEGDYSQREYDDLIDTLTQCYDIPADHAGDLASWAEYGYSGELRDEQVTRDYEEWRGECEVAAMTANQSSLDI